VNIVQKVNSRDIVPRHNNYQEVTVDASGSGPVIDFKNVHVRNTGLAGLSPIKQTGSEYSQDEEHKNQGEQPWYKDDDPTSGYGTGSSKWADRIQDALDIGGFIPGIGVVADLANAGVSALRGDYDKAGFSLLAAVPGLDYISAGAKLGTKGISKANKIRKGLKIPFTNTKVALPTTINPVRRLRTNPYASVGELAVGVDYTASEANPLVEQMGLGKYKESKFHTPEYIVKGIMGFGKGVKKIYDSVSGNNKPGPDQDRLDFEEDMKNNPDSNSNLSNEEQHNIIDKAIEKENKKEKPINYDRTGASTSEKLRKIQEARGYFRDK